MLKSFFGGISAGILIAIGGSVFLSCDNKYVGSILFSVALLCICAKGFVLFTGKVGYIVESHKKNDFIALFSGLVGNLITTFLLGIALSYAVPAMKDTAYTICNTKLTQEIFQTLIRSIFCGVLMYSAVSIYKEKNTFLGILFCVPVFILSGFEHSIADMFYFGASGIYTDKTLLFMITVIIGNSIGGMLLPFIDLFSKDKTK